MKKVFISIFVLLFVASSAALAAGQKKEYQASGEVISADPLYSRVTIKHDAIKGYAPSGETEFFVSSADLLKNISKRDLVDFTIAEEKGSSEIVKIAKTGVAPPKKENLQIGQAVQDVLVATGEVAKGVTSPIEPAHEVVSGTVGATTNTTGAVLENVEGPETKKNF